MSINIQSIIFAAVIFAGVVSQGETDGRWSRQLSTQSVGDWVPLEPSSSPSKRQASSRVLNQPTPFQSSFFPAEPSPNDYVQQGARQLFLQSVPAGQPSFASQQNGINQPFVQLTLTDPQYNPLAQAFVPQRGLQYNVPQFSQIQQPALSSQIVQNPVNLNNQFYSQTKNAFPTQQQKPFKQDAPRYVDGYKLENSTSDYFQNAAKKKPTTPNYKAKPELIGKPTPNNMQKVTERSSGANSYPPTSTVTTVEKEEVQLLYVPLETLQNEKFDAKQLLKNSQKHEAIRDSIGSPGQINNQLYASTTPDYTQRQQTQLHNIHQELIQQAFNTQHLQGKLKQNQFDRQPKYQPSSTVVFPFTQSLYPTPVITTPRSKKLKAHQPPLAVYMEQKSQEKSKLSDVLTVLKEARSISVLDNIGPNSPKVFVGPSNLRTPDNYAKFELPYLSNVDGSRIQRNIDNLPFFVAPLSYKAPDGFAKIPFPAPHVGSVIVNPFMNEFQNTRPTPITDIRSTFGFSTFQQNPSTESFRTTINEIPSQKPSTFNYFPSVTPNPAHTSQSTLSSYHSSFLPYDQQSFNTFRPLPANRRPENNVETSRPPLTSYFTLPPSKPTVSYFSFASPEYTNAPPTTPKPQTPSTNYQYRGHYITNAAIDGSSNGLRLTSEKIQTTPIPTTETPQTYQPHNAFAINQVFQPANAHETNEIKKLKIKDGKEYNVDNVNVVSNTDTYFENKTPSTENIRFSSVDDFSPLPYFGHSTTRKPIEYESSSIVNEPTLTYNQRIKDNYSPVLNQYPLRPSGGDQIENNEQYIQYQTENPTTNEITTPTSTTTTTTTTPAPTTKATVTRRPIHSRGRPRYTTQKSENGEQVTRSTTTRRTPTRRPSTFRSRHENFKSTTTTTTTESSVTESSDYDPSKKESFKTTRYQSYRNKQSEDESKTTTESSLPKTSAATRNLRLRSRGKTHFKPSDNYEGSDYVAKKKKTNNGDSGDSLAYQRDVLHQNYPVTYTEKLTTHEVRTSTALPGSQSVDNGKIRIYETTGSTQKPYENKQFESVSETYDNQPIFQGEQQKFLTPPDSYVEINSENGVSTLASEIITKDVTTDRTYSVKYEEKEVSNQETHIEENSQKKPESDIVKVETYQSTEEAQTESIVTDIPIARFRNKLKSRPKLLKESTPFAEPVEKVEVNTEPNLTFTRRSSVNLQPVTYRPAFDRRKTTMRIEDIEAELKSNRHQLQSDSRSTTFKYPVYIPESSTGRPVNEASSTDNEVTTKRNNFVRRRPVRPTQSSVSVTSPRSRTTTEQTVVNENNQNKRVRVRGRLRTRPTTTTTTEQPNNSQSSEEYVSENSNEKYRKTSERIAPQKYSTRVRQPAQKYFRRPQVDKSSQESDDQATYDSINRPEYVEFTSKRNRDEQYNPENGKAESHWSPKLAFNSFQPIFNPNLIADEMKSEGSEYGTKLPYQEENTEKSEIITIGNAYDDILISVTPSSNKLNDEKTSTTSSGFLASLFEDDKSDTYKTSGGASTFESVLEEVMRNLEQQDEDEYNDDYNKSVMKNEGGEFGKIPPESTILPRKLEENEDENIMVNKEIKRLDEKSFAKSKTGESAEDRVFSTTVENKDFTNGRQARRRGVWRKVKVRPVNKDVFQAAESQFYGNSANDLEIKPVKSSEIFSKSPAIENSKFSEKNKESQNLSTDKNDVQYTTVVPGDYESETKTEFFDKLESLDFGTKLPEYSSYNNEAVTLQPNNRFSDNTETIEDNFTTIDMNESVDEITTEADEYVTTMKSVDSFEDKLNKLEVNSTQRSVVTEISKESFLQTTPEIPQEIPTEITEKQEDIEFTTEVDTTTNIYKSNESDLETKPNNESTNDKVSDEINISKTDFVESTTTPTIFWDPKNIISTSMSTEVSHETEICYRGKCIKTKKQDSKKATIP